MTRLEVSAGLQHLFHGGSRRLAGYYIKRKEDTAGNNDRAFQGFGVTVRQSRYNYTYKL